MKDLQDEYLADLNKAQEQHNKAIEVARAKYFEKMTARFAAFNGERPTFPTPLVLNEQAFLNEVIIDPKETEFVASGGKELARAFSAGSAEQKEGG